MELVFIWLSSLLENNPFQTSFHPCYSFRVTCGRESNTTNILEVYQDNKFNIFDQSKSKGNICNVTALIGNNGAGKTRFIKKLCDIWDSLFVDGNINQYMGEYVIAFSDTKRIIVYNNLTNGLKVDGTSHRNIIMIKEKNQLVNFLWNTYIGLFSNVFSYQDYRKVLLSKQGMNISLMHMLSKAPAFSVDAPFESNLFDPISAYSILETKRELEFLAETKEIDILPFAITNIDIYRMPETRIYPVLRISEDDPEEFKNIQKGIDKHLNEIYSAIQNMQISNQERFCFTAFFLYLEDYLFLRIKKQFNKEIQEIEILLKIFSNEITERELGKGDVLSMINSWLEQTFQMRQDKKGCLLLDDFKEVWKFLVSKDEEELNGDHYHIEIEKNRGKFAKILDFYNHYVASTRGLSEYLRFSWGLSSGEQAILSMYARLKLLKDNMTSFPSSRGNFENNVERIQLIMFIDEADLYLHPAWQQNFLDYILTFFNKYFSDFKIQLVITSHSPIFLSDIPHYNIVRLDDGNTEEKTFGANIYNLYKNNFFKQQTEWNATIGKYAVGQINDVSNTLSLIEDFIDTSKKILNEDYFGVGYSEKTDLITNTVILWEFACSRVAYLGIDLFNEKLKLDAKEKGAKILSSSVKDALYSLASNEKVLNKLYRCENVIALIGEDIIHDTLKSQYFGVIRQLNVYRSNEKKSKDSKVDSELYYIKNKYRRLSREARREFLKYVLDMSGDSSDV